MQKIGPKKNRKSIKVANRIKRIKNLEIKRTKQRDNK